MAAAFDPASYSVPVRNFTEDIYSRNESVYSVWSGTADFSLPDTPYQKILKNSHEGKGRSILVKSGDFSRERRESGNDPRYLMETQFLTVNSPGVRGPSQTAAKKRRPCEKYRILRLQVYHKEDPGDTAAPGRKYCQEP